jgi:hypothetical protein
VEVTLSVESLTITSHWCFVNSFLSNNFQAIHKKTDFLVKGIQVKNNLICKLNPDFLLALHLS